MTDSLLIDDPLWFKDAIIYEVPVRAFADSDADGVGDLRGLTNKLDYLQELGVTAIWILPFFPSPLRDDGYDVADYHRINPIYGTLDDFQNLVQVAHQRGIRVIIELIINHTSDQHPWFQRARRSPKGSMERDFYVWSDTPDKYSEARIIFQDFETSNWTWDPVANAYYWHRFYCHQPDLNFENEAVQNAILDVLDFWLEMGVDGLRMDAVPYLYEQEGTNCENLPATHVFLKKIRERVDQKFSNRMLLAEANQWPEDAVQYYGEGDECHMNFHFPLMPRLFMAVQQEDSFPVVDILQQTPAIPDNCQWALFLRNHDELTLEMVTDEDRDYMYRVYALDPQARLNLGIRRRLAPLLGNDRRRLELLNGLLFSLPGTPVLYYGDEIGMGDNIFLGDRNGVRTPMQWSGDRNAGFSQANPQRLYAPVIVDPEYNYETINVNTQRENFNSLWWWMKKLIALRKNYKAFGRGSLNFISVNNRKILAFTRTFGDEHILVVANLSRFSQAIELDLSAFHGMTSVEMFGRSEFPVITDQAYFLSIAPYQFFWFVLRSVNQVLPASQSPRSIPNLTLTSQKLPWSEIFTHSTMQGYMEKILTSYLPECKWFSEKHRTIQNLSIFDTIHLPGSQEPIEILILHLEYTEGDSTYYLLPVTYGESTKKLTDGWQIEDAVIANNYVIATVNQNMNNLSNSNNKTGLLFAPINLPEFLQLPLRAIAQGENFVGRSGRLVSYINNPDEPWQDDLQNLLTSGSQKNLGNNKTFIVYGDRLIFKLYRQLNQGINADLEVGKIFTELAKTANPSIKEHFSPIIGYWQYESKVTEPITLGILAKYIPNVKDGWDYFLDSLRDYFDKVLTRPQAISETTLTNWFTVIEGETEIPAIAQDLVGGFFPTIELLGKRTGEMHQILSSVQNPAFTPEPFTSFYQRSIYQYMRNLTGQACLKLQKQLPMFSPGLQSQVKIFLNQQQQILDMFGLVLDKKIIAVRTRCHGDYDLGRVLYTGKDFIVIDFEGDPGRPLSERRIKRSPLRDVASMMQSLYSVMQTAIQREQADGIREEELMLLERFAHFWFFWVSGIFLRSYLKTVDKANFMPTGAGVWQILLRAYLMERSIQELNYRLDHQPETIELALAQMYQWWELTGMNGME